jgi:hypothetical protein
MGETVVRAESVTLNDKIAGDEIVFKTINDMRSAYKEIDNGNDLLVVVEGKTTLLRHSVISPKLYEGSLLFSALEQPR